MPALPDDGFKPDDPWELKDPARVILFPFVGGRVVVLRGPDGWSALEAPVAGEHWCVAATQRLRQRAGAQLDSDRLGPLLHPFAVLGRALAAPDLCVAAWCEVQLLGEPVAESHLLELDHADQVLPPEPAALFRTAATLRTLGVDDATWTRDSVRLLEEHYLRAPTPEGQSGKLGDAADWELSRRLLVRPVHHDGSFLDLGCANGLLMESVHRWAAEEGRRLDPYGLDASARLVAAARERLPQWHDRFFVGDALTWEPPQRFDFVHTMVDLVPPRRRPDWLRRVLDELVAPEGRLIVRDYLGIGERLRTWGLPVAGTTVQERGAAKRPQEAAWLDKSG
ncbi:MAG: class I SAM-dependent methyltransferase [Candidatus Dormibacteraeota bacterium]|nr:class I SAM-dependent methyltransferase [Candidatus Dormibacteraeota bacterium]